MKTKQTMRPQGGSGILLLLFSLITAFRVYFMASLNLIPDESYYWLWSQHLDLSYYDHPPMVSYLIKITTSLFGNHAWSVRLPALLMGLGCSSIVYSLTQQIFKSKKGGILSVIILNSLLIFSANIVLMTPDAPLIFFWLLTLYFSYKAIFQDKTTDWAMTGVSLGLGLLSKYTMIFFFPSLFLFLLSTQRFRHLLYSWKPWFSLSIALLIFSPVIVWNYQHQWISFLFQFHHGTASRTHPGVRYLIEFLGSQAILFSPLIFAGFFWALWKSWKVGRDKGLHQFSFLFWTVFPAFAFFIYESLRSKIEGNWAGFSQAGSIILLGGFLSEKIQDRNENFRIRFYTILMIVFSLSVTVVIYLQPFLKLIPLSVEQDRTNDLIGWEEMNQIKIKYPEIATLPILTTRHTLVGEVSFYLRHSMVYQWGTPYRITDLTQASPLPPRGSTFLLITVDDHDFSETAKSLFTMITPLADIPVHSQKGQYRVQIRTYHFFWGKNFLGLPFNRPQ